MGTLLKVKIKSYLLAINLLFLPLLIIIAILASGMLAIGSFFSSLFSWGTKNSVDIDSLSLPQLIEYVQDDSILTDEALEQMMIGREELTYLLTTVNNYNTRIESKEITVEVNDTYEKISYIFDPLVKKRIKKKEIINGTEDFIFSVNNSAYTAPYTIDWQTVFIFSVYTSLKKQNNNDATEREISKEDIDNIIEMVKPSFTYYYDAVNNSKDFYSIQDVVYPIPRYYWSYQFDSHSYSGYIPVSGLKEVKTLLYTDIYTPNADYTSFTKTDTIDNSGYLISIGKSITNDFDFEIFISLLQNLPGGKSVASRYLRYSYEVGGSSGGISRTRLTDSEKAQILNAITNAETKQVVSFALSKVGYPYSQRYRDSGDYFDCSSLAFYSWKSAGVNISYGGASTAAAEAQNLDIEGKTVSLQNVQPGDLIFYSYKYNRRYLNISHVAIYVGDGKVVEALNERTGVVFRDMQNLSDIVLIGRP